MMKLMLKIEVTEIKKLYMRIKESLILRRALSFNHVEDEEDWLWKNIFHTRCTSNRNVYNVIIDGSSFENVVPYEMVEKLKLKTTVYPNPYKFFGFKKNEIKVNQCCLVSFSIEKKNYKDEVWCDVVGRLSFTSWSSVAIVNIIGKCSRLPQIRLLFH